MRAAVTLTGLAQGPRLVLRGGGMIAAIDRALALRRSRRALAALDDAGLRDVGLGAAEAQAEARRPVWDAGGFGRR